MPASVSNSEPLLADLRLTVQFVAAWNRRHYSLMAAACAYSALLAVVPALVVSMSVVGFVVHASSARTSAVLHAVQAYIPVRAPWLRSVLASTAHNRATIGIIGLLSLAYTVARCFLAVEAALNTASDSAPVRTWIHRRLVALECATAAIIMLSGDVFLTGLIPHLHLHAHSAGWRHIAAVMLVVATVGLTALEFAFFYSRLLEPGHTMRSLLSGGAIASLTFQTTKIGFAVLLLHLNSYDAVYGTAAGLIIVVVWAWYSMAIFLGGAELVRLHTVRRGVNLPGARVAGSAEVL
ncbi:MAG: YihY/virulence factor BrkB family protein [Armatimonadetes bacterium]|nr:YihY/virulence factor BrkB family protein [Armatimonadota bacterium]MDE2207070.1 YihY/virulence factor BrkB family protein [Armatimonadota bacterium]